MSELYVNSTTRNTIIGISQLERNYTELLLESVFDFNDVEFQTITVTAVVKLSDECPTQVASVAAFVVILGKTSSEKFSFYHIEKN